MNRRNKNKSAASAPVRPSPAPKQTSTPVNAIPPPAPAPAPSLSVKPTLSQSAKPVVSPSQLAALAISAKLRQEWKSFEIWLSARRAERDKQVSEKLKELMSSKAKSRFAQPPTDMSTFEATLNDKLAAQAREEWVRRLDKASLNEEDWIDITPAEMAAVEAAFVSTPSTDAKDVYSPVPETPPIARSASHEFVPSSLGHQDWMAPVPGGWDTPAVTIPSKSTNKRPPDPSIPVRSSPLTSGWSISSEKPNENLWDLQMKASQKPPTPPLSGGPTPDTLWDMHMNKNPPTPPSETTSSEELWETPPPKKSSGQQNRAPSDDWEFINPNGKKSSGVKPTTNIKQTPRPESRWSSSTAAPPPSPPAAPEPTMAFPMHTGSSVESAHNHGYMSPLLLELEADEFPIASPDVLSDDLVEESIREWHRQAAEADIELRRRLVKMHWSHRDWDELLGNHIHGMESSARAVVSHWKKTSDVEKERLLAEDKHRRLAGIRNVTSGNRRWGAGTPVPPASAPTPAPPVAPQPVRGKMPVPVPEPDVKKQPLRKAGGKKPAVTVEDVTSDQDDRSSTPSISTTKSKMGADNDSFRSKDVPAKGAAGLMSSIWGKGSTPTPEPEPRPRTGSNATRPVNGIGKGAFSPTEPARRSSTPSLWDEPPAPKNPSSGKGFWNSGPPPAEEKDTDEAGWGSTSAWGYAMNAIMGERAGTPAKFNSKTSDSAAAGPSPLWQSSADNKPDFDEEFGGFGDQAKFSTWKPSRAPEKEYDAEDMTMKTADLAFKNLCQGREDEINEPAPMPPKAATNSNRKRNGQAGRK